MIIIIIITINRNNSVHPPWLVMIAFGFHLVRRKAFKKVLVAGGAMATNNTSGGCGVMLRNDSTIGLNVSQSAPVVLIEIFAITLKLLELVKP